MCNRFPAQAFGLSSSWTVPIFAILETSFQSAPAMDKMSEYISFGVGVSLGRSCVRGGTILFPRMATFGFFSSSESE